MTGTITARACPTAVAQGRAHPNPDYTVSNHESTSDEILVLTEELDAIVTVRQANFNRSYVFDFPEDRPRFPLDDAAYLPIGIPADGLAYDDLNDRILLRRDDPTEIVEITVQEDAE